MSRRWGWGPPRKRPECPTCKAVLTVRSPGGPILSASFAQLYLLAKYAAREDEPMLSVPPGSGVVITVDLPRSTSSGGPCN